MSKNITEMSFDDIFPETSFPKSKSIPSDYSSDSFSDDADDFTYSDDDYGTDISSFANDISIGETDAVPPPQNPAPPYNSFSDKGTPSQNGYNSPAGNPTPAYFNSSGRQQNMDERVYNYTQANPDSLVTKTIKGYYGNYQRQGNKNVKMPAPAIIAIISFFFSTFFPVGLILSIIAFVMVSKKTNEESNMPSGKGIRSICIIALIVNISMSVIKVLFLLLPFISSVSVLN